MSDRVGVLGGTFDPIHAGHLEAAQAARGALSLDRIILLPARTPPHRSVEPRASGFHRFAMASLAASEGGAMAVSELELLREGPSYTSMTLENLHAAGLRPSQLFFILGSDAFADIAGWHDYPQLFGLSNFVVVSRPGFPVPNPQSPITGSPTSVFFIEAHTPDVSSTDIRRRVGAGESIDRLVPRSVAGHIHRHRLYVPAPVAAVL
ncbi:MAG: nicotinate (nicotinamide) nucleotide adenylyltransferase [Acidobacteria bacterium]|nr:nicotinate (nicotinamide) nucleotide adenylyltransferase [Acidobacteriota bacterium]